MIKAEGNGLSECYNCKQNKKYSLTWTSFLYKIKCDNFKNLYCYECAKKLEQRNGVKKMKFEDLFKVAEEKYQCDNDKDFKTIKIKYDYFTISIEGNEVNL